MLPSSKNAVRRVLALLVLTLLLPAVLPAAGARTQPAKPAASIWSPLGSLWDLVVRAACAKGISIDGKSCPVDTTAGGCDRGSTIDPNGGCAP